MFIFSVSCFIYIFIANNQCVRADYHENHELANLTKSERSEFVLLYPRTFLAGKNETVCLVLESKHFPFNVSVDLRIRNKHYYTLDRVYTETKCFKLAVPAQKTLEILKLDMTLTLQSRYEQLQEKSLESILVYPAIEVFFIETDRYIFRPGDNVKIRILIVTQDMQTNYLNMSVNVKIINPEGFIVFVWNNLAPRNGLIHLDFQLTNDTSLGAWNIECNKHRKPFLVKNYILPRFKIFASIPKTIYLKTTHISFKICSKYTFGNPLKGVGFAKITLPHDNKFSTSKLQTLLDNGCTYFNFTTETFPLSETMNNLDVMNVFITVTEDGTNQMETEYYHINIQKKPFELKFLNEDYFQPGLPYRNKLKLIRGFASDYRNEFVEICFQVAWKNEWNLKPIECTTFAFDKEGIIPFSILPFKENVKKVKITASSLNHTNLNANTLIVNKWFSNSASYLKIERNSKLYTKCKGIQLFTVYFTTNKLKHNDKIIFYYTVTTPNDIQMLKQHKHVVHKNFINFHSEIGNTLQTSGNFTKLGNYVDKFMIKLKMHEKIYSKGQLLVFYFNKGEIVSNTMNIYVEKCLAINVTASWSSNNILPGVPAKLKIKSAPNSTCALSSVDIANHFLDSNRQLTVNKLLQPFLVRREKEFLKQNCLNNNNLSKDMPCNCSQNFDTFEDFNYAGVSAITNTEIILKPCKAEELVAPYYQIISDDDYDDNPSNIHTIRTYFPSTWHWELLDMNDTGHVIFSTKTPHSITTWNTNVICSSKIGIGVANLQLKAQKLFFIDFVAPETMKRFEIFNLQIVAYNYYNYSLPINLVVSTNLEQINNRRKDNVICISPKESHALAVRLRGNNIGEAYINVKGTINHSNKDCSGSYYLDTIEDAVEKKVNVLPHGYPQEKSKTILLCGREEPFNLTWNFDIPVDYVLNSERVSAQLYSDMMGPVMHNLEDLILLPTGCGEQIMAVMAPNFYVLKYFKAINQLTPFMKKRIFKNLQIGYQKILDYVHTDGSFSAFGFHDPGGSMFLTSFVVRCLSEAKEHIFIDERILKHALEWIMKHQLENGCFASVSHVFQDMGGASMENSTSALTSYVVISLLESKASISESVRSNAIYCIKGQLDPDLYSLAINTYALYLLGADNDATFSMHKLLEQANKRDNLMWWNCTRDSKSMDIETSSYVLMSLLHKLSNDNLIYANAVVRWLLHQRNSNGGFISSQDTVVALDAISRYSLIMNNRNPNMNITISNDKATYHSIFKKSDTLKMEQFNFIGEKKQLNLSIEGTGCVLTQFIAHYNLESPRINEAFELNMNTANATRNCDVNTLNPCFSYKERNQSSMIVMEVSLPTGYSSDQYSLNKLIGSPANIKKIEKVSNKVIFYFTNLNSNTLCLAFNVSRSITISGLQNATVLLYEYYNPEIQVLKDYNISSQCISNINNDITD